MQIPDKSDSPGTSGDSGVSSQPPITPQVTPENQKVTDLTFAKTDTRNTYEVEIDNEVVPSSSNTEKLIVSFADVATDSKFSIKTSTKVAKNE